MHGTMLDQDGAAPTGYVMAFSNLGLERTTMHMYRPSGTSM